MVDWFLCYFVLGFTWYLIVCCLLDFELWGLIVYCFALRFALVVGLIACLLWVLSFVLASCFTCLILGGLLLSVLLIFGESVYCVAVFGWITVCVFYLWRYTDCDDFV